MLFRSQRGGIGLALAVDDGTIPFAIAVDLDGPHSAADHLAIALGRKLAAVAGTCGEQNAVARLEDHGVDFFQTLPGGLGGKPVVMIAAEPGIDMIVRGQQREEEAVAKTNP